MKCDDRYFKMNGKFFSLKNNYKNKIFSSNSNRVHNCQGTVLKLEQSSPFFVKAKIIFASK